MPNQVDISVAVLGFLQAMEHLGEKDVVESTERWMAEYERGREVRIRQFAAAMAEFERVQNEATKALGRAGWLGLERHFTDAQALEALDIEQKKGDVAMNEAIAQYFNADDGASLSEMTAAWSAIPYLRDREAIITDSLWAHRQGRFTLSVPALLPLAEGLSAEIVGNAVSNQNVVKAVARDWKLQTTEIWSEVFADVVEQIIYKRYDFTRDPAPFLSRHGILHGRVPDYGDNVNSLRLFLLVDAIAFLWLEKQHKTPFSAAP
jgi:hypothetical protein